MSNMGDRAEHLRDKAQEAVNTASEVARHHAQRTGESVGEVGQYLREAVQRSVERQPLVSVLLAAAAGLLIGGLLRR